MKKTILTLIIGILIGATITTAVFLVLKGNNKRPDDRFNRGEMPAMNGEFPNGNKGFQKPNFNEPLNTIEE